MKMFDASSYLSFREEHRDVFIVGPVGKTIRIPVSYKELQVMFLTKTACQWKFLLNCCYR